MGCGWSNTTGALWHALKRDIPGIKRVQGGTGDGVLTIKLPTGLLLDFVWYGYTGWPQDMNGWMTLTIGLRAPLGKQLPPALHIKHEFKETRYGTIRVMVADFSLLELPAKAKPWPMPKPMSRPLPSAPLLTACGDPTKC